ncbi:hypothetical protein DEJ13_17545 [Curtobacterium sp. MCLR17_007]|uniref:hypothetical protein n=1 Tax=Curtobacterium sp. MCLR17_007 TaxID=2175648 RepID=UPI0011B7A7E8|nr:hypothetical protein [Curtobacterium sp. MCLR17_007]WIB60220.1 hypothetical protein DEJ13_17545 [Curtobacterium sp. MCLR17_007]
MASPEEAHPKPTAVDDPRKASAQLLREGAKRWMRDALEAWSNDDLEHVAMIAPLSLELLGKATLWDMNPVLVMPSAPSEEQLLRSVSRPDLRDPSARTVGLGGVLSRLASLIPNWPIPKSRQSLIADVRNGAAHVGITDRVESVLQDCLLATAVLLPHVGLTKEQHFGPYAGLVDALMNKRRETVEGRVKLRREQALAQLAALEARLGRTGYEGALVSKESARRLLDPSDSGRIGVDSECPACDYVGRLQGEADIEVEVDVDVERDVDGWKPVYQAFPVVWFHPDEFACAVCNFRVSDQEELAEAGLPGERYVLESGEYDEALLENWQDQDY